MTRAETDRLAVAQVIYDYIGWDNCRWTGTLQELGGRWVIVQMHFSFPKDD